MNRIAFFIALAIALAAGFAQTKVDLPKPFATPSVTKYPAVIGWAENKMPTVPQGFTVKVFASELDSPRWMLVLPNGDVLVAESTTEPKPDTPPDKVAEQVKSGSAGKSANRITLLRDANNDGAAESKKDLLTGLRQPFGMAWVDGTLYVANTDGVLRFAYQPGQDQISARDKKILDLPAGGYNNHWTRNVIPSADGRKLYVTVGSASNVMEHGEKEEIRRASILEINPDGTGERVYASGLRNPNGLDWEPTTNTLWTAVNERDGLGDDLVPDYITGVREGGFYGWPYAYWGQNEDPRLAGKRPDLVSKSIVPDVSVGSHTAALGLVFYRPQLFPERYRGGAFVALRGSWNRSKLAGYKVVFVPFGDGRPSGDPEDFLTGFIADEAKPSVYGRPVGLALMKDGSLLVADDAGDRIWRVSPVER